MNLLLAVGLLVVKSGHTRCGYEVPGNDFIAQLKGSYATQS